MSGRVEKDLRRKAKARQLAGNHDQAERADRPAGARALSSVQRFTLDPQEALELASVLSSAGDPENGIPPEVVTVEDLEALVAEGALDDLDPELAAEILATWTDEPWTMVQAIFRPKPTVFSPTGIDAWQLDVLHAAVWAQRIALKACKGPGKSCVLAWLIWWFLLTRPHANVVVTSITRENLRDGLWKELAKWYARSPYLQRVFAFNSDRIQYRDAPATWWASARGWAKDADPEQQANTMAGLHGDHVLIVHDEVSDYPDGVLAASEGIFYTDGQEAKLLVAGNPTRQDGPLWRICTAERSKWSRPRGLIVEITGDPLDPKRSPRINLEEARQAIALHGREDSWVMTNILGKFPRVASDKLLGPDDVHEAVERDIPPAHWVHEPKVMGLDVAWDGDDSSVLVMRQGPVVFKPTHWHGLDEDELAEQVAMLVLKHRPVRIYVDGIGIGHGVVNRLRKILRGRCEVVDVQSGAASPDPRYLNLRAFMWWTMAKAVKRRLALPDHARLRSDLVAPKTRMTDGGGHKFKQALESKADMKKRGLPSPDWGDALAFTFAWPDPIASSGLPLDEELEGASRATQKFDPCA